MNRLGMAAIAIACISASAWAAPLSAPATSHDRGNLQLVKDNPPPPDGNKGPQQKGPDQHKPEPKKPDHHEYKPGHKYDKAPKGWKKHGKRPGDWKKRGCVVVGPVWFCP